ncbi:MAG: carotenoid biosynthesis protein [Nitritalea sp.]
MLTQMQRDASPTATSPTVRYAMYLLALMHLAGVVGMSVPALQPIFQLLTPFHLLACLLALLYFHRDWSLGFVFFLSASFIIGFGSEVMGVKTGFPFGSYSYGPVLGWQLWEVPILIGVNWMLLVYISAHVVRRFAAQKYLQVILASTLMVLLDFLIEPVAIALDFWSWENTAVPVSNYIGWFGVAVLIQAIYAYSKFEKQNPLADFLLLNLAFFFLILNFLL